jgi:hypothetical protein
MMNYFNFLASIFLAAVCGFSVQGFADFGSDTTQQIAQVTTDANRNLVCNLSVTVSDQKQLTSLQYVCTGLADGNTQASYTVAEVQSGFVMYHEKSHNIDVAVLSAPGFDAVRGGAINIHYLYNYLSSTYSDYKMALQPQNGKWIAFDPRGQGFNKMYLVANSFLGNLIGIKDIQTSWSFLNFSFSNF